MAETIVKTGENTFDIVRTEEVRISKSIADLKVDISIYTESRDSWQAKIDEAQAQIDEALAKGVKEVVKQ